MSKQYNFCNNCGKNGHMFHQCKQPITSIGVIAFRYNKGEAEYLMIRRKDSLGFVDFMRGKYPLHNKNYLMNIIDEMTVGEKERLLTMDFDELWSYLWGDNIGIQYRGEEKVSRDKFSSLKHGIKTNNTYFTLNSLIANSNTAWETPEFQKSEVSKVEWKPYSDVCKMIRPYNLEKIDVITRVNTVLSNLRLYM
jgi:hypothetical protein